MTCRSSNMRAVPGGGRHGFDIDKRSRRRSHAGRQALVQTGFSRTSIPPSLAKAIAPMICARCWTELLGHVVAFARLGLAHELSIIHVTKAKLL